MDDLFTETWRLFSSAYEQRTLKFEVQGLAPCLVGQLVEGEWRFGGQE